MTASSTLPPPQQPIGAKNRQHAEAFLQLLYGGDDAAGFIGIWTREDKRSDFVPATDLTGAALLAVRLAETMNVYLGLGLRRKYLGPTRRGSADDICAVPGLWVEIDVAGAAHRATNLPPTLEDAVSLVEGFLLKPTVLVHSGHGLHAYWLLKELFITGSIDERTRVQSLLRRFQATIRAMARARGWHVDTTSDLARVLRIPGSWNRKGGCPPVEVRIVLARERLRYAPDDFEAILSDVDDDPPRESPSREDRNDPPARIEPILGRCGWLRHCLEDAAILPEPEWYAMLGIVGRCEDGERLAHEWSAPYPGYGREETADKLRHALEAAGPRTCSYIRRELGGERYCAACPARGLVRSPIVLGAPTDPGEVILRPDGLRTIRLEPGAVRIWTAGSEEIAQWRD